MLAHDREQRGPWIARLRAGNFPRHRTSRGLKGALLGWAILAAPTAPALQAASQSVPAPAPQGAYDLILLGPAEVSWNGSAAFAISNAGKVAGFVQKSVNGMAVPVRAVWDLANPGTPATADPGGGAYVGFSANGLPFGYDGPYPGYPYAQPLFPTGGDVWLSAKGARIVGYRPNGAKSVAVASYTELKVPPGASHSVAFAVNAAGMAVGQFGPPDHHRPCKWAPSGQVAVLPWSASVQTGSAFDLGFGAAMAVNDAGEIVGYSAGPQGTPRATIWGSGGPTVLGTLGQRSLATAINASGTAVGWFLDTAGMRHAFVARKGQPMTDLNAVVHRGPADSDWMVAQAFSINDQGAICGIAVRPGASPRAVVLRPRSGSASVFTAIQIERLAQRLTPSKVSAAGF